GVLLFAQSRFEESVKSYQAALASRPWLAQAHLGLASALTRLGRTDEATRAAQLQLAAAAAHAPLGYPEHVLLTLMSEAHVLAGEHAEARAVLTRVLREHPEHVPALLAYSRLVRSNVRLALTLANLGVIYSETGRQADAEDAYRKALMHSPHMADTHYNLSAAAAAVRVITQLITPSGQLLLEQNRVAEAVAVWLKAATLDPSDATTAFNTATALRLAGDNANAEAFYRRAVLLNPKDVTSLRNLGAMLHLTGQLQEARQLYERALSLAPHDPHTLTNLARLSALTRPPPPL
ncbi:protein O-mannosyl-transferase TMTC2-like, partial [Hyalella azteca]|uniref:Protein O-mannosyl-transferase TMTC2-like n=1 Tax=Hyalella azteca TaxID=294128 RepID=A0A979FU26_HYAAZ